MYGDLSGPKKEAAERAQSEFLRAERAYRDNEDQFNQKKRKLEEIRATNAICLQVTNDSERTLESLNNNFLSLLDFDEEVKKAKVFIDGVFGKFIGVKTDVTNYYDIEPVLQSLKTLVTTFSTVDNLKIVESSITLTAFIQSNSGQVMQATPEGGMEKSENRSTWERFTLLPYGPKKYRLRTFHQTFVGKKADNTLYHSKARSEDQIFTIDRDVNHFTIKAFDGLNVAMDAGGNIKCQKLDPSNGNATKFYLVPHVPFAPFKTFIVSHFNTQFAVTPQREATATHNYSTWETFTIVPGINGKFGIKTSYNTYFSARDDSTVTTTDLLKRWESFDFELQPDNSGNFSIKTCHNTYISVNQGGQCNLPTWNELDEKFLLVPILEDVPESGDVPEIKAKLAEVENLTKKIEKNLKAIEDKGSIF